MRASCAPQSTAGVSDRTAGRRAAPKPGRAPSGGSAAAKAASVGVPFPDRTVGPEGRVRPPYNPRTFCDGLR